MKKTTMRIIGVCLVIVYVVFMKCWKMTISWRRRQRGD